MTGSTAPAAVYELRGDGIEEGYYCFGAEQTARSLLNAGGAVNNWTELVRECIATGRCVGEERHQDLILGWRERNSRAFMQPIWMLPAVWTFLCRSLCLWQ